MQNSINEALQKQIDKLVEHAAMSAEVIHQLNEKIISYEAKVLILKDEIRELTKKIIRT